MIEQKANWTPIAIAWEIARALRLEVRKGHYEADYSIGYGWTRSDGTRDWNAYYSFTEEWAKDLISSGNVEKAIENVVRTVNSNMAAVGNRLLENFLAEASDEATETRSKE